MDPSPILFALAATTVLLAAAWRPWRPAAAPRSAAWGGALAVPVAGLLAFTVQNAWSLPSLPPERPPHWLLWGTLLCAPLAWLEPRRGGWTAAFGLLWGAALIAGTRSLRELSWVEGGGVLGPLVPALVGVCVAFGVRHALARRNFSAPSDALGLLLWGVGIALILGQTYAGGALVVGAVCTALGGAWVLGLWRPDRCAVAGLTAPVVFALLGMLFMGAYYNELESRPAALGLALAPLLLLLGGEGRWALARLALVAAAVAGCVYWGWPASNPYADLYGAL